MGVCQVVFYTDARLKGFQEHISFPELGCLLARERNLGSVILDQLTLCHEPSSRNTFAWTWIGWVVGLRGSIGFPAKITKDCVHNATFVTFTLFCLRFTVYPLLTQKLYLALFDDVVFCCRKHKSTILRSTHFLYTLSDKVAPLVNGKSCRGCSTSLNEEFVDPVTSEEAKESKGDSSKH